MRKEIMGKKEIASNLLFLAEMFIDSANNKASDKEGKKIAHAQAYFLLELARSYL